MRTIDDDDMNSNDGTKQRSIAQRNCIIFLLHHLHIPASDKSISLSMSITTFSKAVAAAFLLTSYMSFGQSVDLQQNPPGVDWKVIETQNYEVIFPSELAGEGRRVASMIERNYTQVNGSLHVQPGRLSLILSNRTTVANGYMGFAPRRSMWYCTPPQSSLLGSSDWLSLLATHELRHTAQYERFKTGFTEFAYWLFGEYGWAGMSGFSIPMWVWEGDAVVSETIMGHSGRARMPYFDRDIRTNLLSNRHDSYYKAYLGSYKDWCPSYYNLGTLMTMHFRRAYGADAWNNVLRRGAAWSFIPGSFSIFMNDEIGRTSVELYEETMADLESRWRRQADGLVLTDAKILTDTMPDCWTNYLYPQKLDDGSIVAQKWGMDNHYSLVRLHPDGSEEHLCLIGANGDPISARGHLVVWDEKRPDWRWGLRNWSVVCVYDIEKGERRSLTSGTRLFSPCLSPKGDRIAAVEYLEDAQCSLVILDAETGKLLSRFPSPGNEFIQTPAWSDDGNRVAMLRIHKTDGMALSVLDVSTGGFSDIIPHSCEVMSNPSFAGDCILFSSPRSGIDNLHAVSVVSGRRWMVTSRLFGAYQPSAGSDGRTILFADYSSHGHNIASMPLDTSRWIPISSVADCGIHYIDPIVEREATRASMPAAAVALTAAIDTLYTVHDYNQWSSLINIHTWMIVPNMDGTAIGARLMSTNIMNTLTLNAGYMRNLNENGGTFSAGVVYSGLYPIIDVTGSTGKRASTYHDNNNNTQHYSWRENTVKVGLNVPIVITRVVPAHFLLSADMYYTHITDLEYWDTWDQAPGHMARITYSTHFFKGYQWYRDLYPRIGTDIDLSFTHMPFKGTDYRGRQATALAHVYLPGLWRNHGIRLDGGYERQWDNNYHFESRMLFPRGYGSRYHEILAKASVNYALPLVYPDINIWSLVYLKRVWINGFYEWGQGGSARSWRIYRSTGAELNWNLNLLSIPIEWAVGIRSSYLLDEKKWHFGLTLGYSI